jgi:hypothetical protein
MDDVTLENTDWRDCCDELSVEEQLSEDLAKETDIYDYLLNLKTIKEELQRAYRVV